jgi:hypothetical protein
VAKTLLIAAGQEASAGGATKWMGDVAAGAADASFGEGIEVGRRNVLAALKAAIRVAEIVGKDQEDVRLLGSRG